jgi:hypothetical protein
MNLLIETVASVLRGLLKVALIAVSALLVLAVLCIGLLFAATMVIRFVVTGRRPTMTSTFGHFQHATQRFRPRPWSGQGSQGSSNSADVVDVQAHEVRPVLGSSSSGVRPD